MLRTLGPGPHSACLALHFSGTMAEQAAAAAAPAADAAAAAVEALKISQLKISELMKKPDAE